MSVREGERIDGIRFITANALQTNRLTWCSENSLDSQILKPQLLTFHHSSQNTSQFS